MNQKKQTTNVRSQSQNTRNVTPTIFQSAFDERKWLTKHGK